MGLEGSKTLSNLLAAFAGESQARNRYTYFSSVAKKEGYERIADIFLETAENEKEHAKLFLTKAGGLGKDTAANLEAAANGEMEEWSSMYPEFARVAREEGFEEVAKLFDKIAAIEAHHEERYRALLKQVKDDTVYKKEKTVRWICKNCGHIHEGPEAPDICPTCSHPQSYFEILTEEF
jgi:rubrerythrin